MCTFNVLLFDHFFLHLKIHHLFSVRSQQDKGRKVRQVRSAMRRCSHFHPLCIFVKSRVKFLYHNIPPPSLAMKFRNITTDFILQRLTNVSHIPQPRTTVVSNTCMLFFDSAVSQKEKSSLQIDVHIDHPDSAFTFVSKYGAFVL